MSDLLAQLEFAIELVPGPAHRVEDADGMIRASAWDDALAIEIEADVREGLFVLLAAVEADGRPAHGSYRDESGRLVRMHAAELIRESAPDLSRRLSGILGSFSDPPDIDGPWEELGRVAAEVWSHARGLHLLPRS